MALRAHRSVWLGAHLAVHSDFSAATHVMPLSGMLAAPWRHEAFLYVNGGMPLPGGAH